MGKQNGIVIPEGKEGLRYGGGGFKKKKKKEEGKLC